MSAKYTKIDKRGVPDFLNCCRYGSTQSGSRSVTGQDFQLVTSETSSDKPNLVVGWNEDPVYTVNYRFIWGTS